MQDGTVTIASPATTSSVLAIDLGKFRSVACVFEASDGTHRFETIVTTPAAVALARKILIWCWAMLRDEAQWDDARGVPSM